MPLHIDTPLATVPGWLSAHGHPVLFKLDALQPSGSFKLRGVGRFCEAAVAEGATAIVCASGGNAGFAAAWAGRALGVPVSIVVPETTAPEARAAIAAAGADVIVHGAAFDEAAAHARACADMLGAAYVHPFDHPLLWDGHASLIDEVVAAGAEFDGVITSVGGGGLMLGLLQGLRRNGLAHVPLLAVETEGADALNRSLLAGTPVTLPAISSIATSLGARRVADAAFEAARGPTVASITLRDAEAVAGCLKAADALRLLVEPACGAAIAALDHPAASAFRRPLVVVCGGIGVSLARLGEWRARFAL